MRRFTGTRAPRAVTARRALAIAVLVAAWVVPACAVLDEPPGPLPEPAPSTAAASEPVSLVFEPVAPEPLAPGHPGDDLVAAGTVSLEASGRAVAVHFFTSRTDPRETVAFVADGDAWFSLGLVSSYGDAQASARDWTGDGVPELTVSGSLGATYVESRIIGYDDGRGAWVVWLAAGAPQVVQREPDGRPVLIEGSRGALPSYVRIYRWHGAGFEGVDVATALDVDYAAVLDATGLIEVGRTAAPAQTMRYRYGDGSLLPVGR